MSDRPLIFRTVNHAEYFARLVKLARMPQEDAKRIIRELWNEEPYCARRIASLIEEIGKEPIGSAVERTTP